MKNIEIKKGQKHGYLKGLSLVFNMMKEVCSRYKKGAPVVEDKKTRNFTLVKAQLCHTLTRIGG